MTGYESRPDVFTSQFDIPYSNLSAFNNLDVHFPTNPAPESQNSGLWLVWIHGGAFRDPIVTSRSILPTLSFLFDPSSPHYQPKVHGVASLNYRLSPYPKHPTDPSRPGDPARSSKWPDYFVDVKAGIEWILNQGNKVDQASSQSETKKRETERRYILAGHSVGGTMAMLLAQSDPAYLAIPLPLAIIPLYGIYNFTTLRNTHLENKDIYNDFTTAAFGPEDEGGWELGNCTTMNIREEVKIIVMGHGKEDRLVDWGQAEEMAPVLDKANEKVRGKAVMVDVKGDHDEVWKGGLQIAGCVNVAVGILGARGCL